MEGHAYALCHVELCRVDVNRRRADVRVQEGSVDDLGGQDLGNGCGGRQQLGQRPWGERVLALGPQGQQGLVERQDLGLEQLKRLPDGLREIGRASCRERVSSPV